MRPHAVIQKKVNPDFLSLPDKLPRGSIMAMEDLSREMVLYITSGMRAPKTGKWYRKPKAYGGGFYQASAPGEMPAIRTRRLLSSIVKHRTGKYAWEIGPLRAGFLISYARWLEYGTTNMLPRPFMAPAIKWLQDKVKDRFGELVEVVFRERPF